MIFIMGRYIKKYSSLQRKLKFNLQVSIPSLLIDNG
ncbi:MAG: hypothetical protein ACI93R_004064 [Flavobacteriales bacterium]|jgi:hypothetical protein